MKRKCIFPNCNAILNQYNKDKVCFMHHRILFQNDLSVKGNSIVESVDREVMSVIKKGKNKGKKRLHIKTFSVKVPSIRLRFIKEIGLSLNFGSSNLSSFDDLSPNSSK